MGVGMRQASFVRSFGMGLVLFMGCVGHEPGSGASSAATGELSTETIVLDSSGGGDGGAANGDDTWLDEAVPTAPHGASTQLDALFISSAERRVVVRFDPAHIRAVAAGRQLVTADLRMWSDSLHGGFEMHRIASAFAGWTATQATFNCPDTACAVPWSGSCFPTSAPTCALSAGAIDTFKDYTGEAGWAKWTITGVVRSLIEDPPAAGADPGFVIFPYHLPDASGSSFVSSRDTAHLEHRPQLVLVFADGSFAPVEPTPPAIDRSAPTHVFSAMSWMLEPALGLQLGIAPGTIDPNRASLIRGHVADAAGTPLPGVRITVLGHSGSGDVDFGEARTRRTAGGVATGNFEMMVNGGGPLTLRYELDGFLPAERSLDVPWNDWIRAPDVVLLRRDSLTCSNTVGGSVGRFAEPTTPGAWTTTDARGTRTMAVWVPGGTMVQHDAGTSTTFQICTSEYTRGASGPSAMPAELPATTSYTYASELEARDVGGTDPLTHPHFRTASAASDVYLYLRTDAFLDFAPGTVVPNGSYDATRGAWNGDANGMVLEISAADTDCVDAGPATSPVTDAQELAALCVGRALPAGRYMRVPLAHFTPVDLNWVARLLGLIPRAGIAGNRGAANSCDVRSSIVYCEAQTLGERLPIAGTPYSLMYLGDRQRGREERWRVSVTPVPEDPVAHDCAARVTNLGSGFRAVHLELVVAGRSFPATGPTVLHAADGYCSPHELEWDGLDAYGRRFVGPQRAYVRVGYEFDLAYEAASDGGSSFGAGVDVGAELTPHNTVIAWVSYREIVGTIDDHQSSLGGFGIDAHHFYDPATSILYMGNGTRRTAESVANVIRTVASSVSSAGSIGAMTTGPEGSLYYWDAGHDPSDGEATGRQRLHVRRRGDAAARLLSTQEYNNVTGLSVGPWFDPATGSRRDVLYVVDAGGRVGGDAVATGCALYRVDLTTGSRTRLLGTPSSSLCSATDIPNRGTHLDASGFEVGAPTAVAAAGDASVFISDGSRIIRYVETSTDPHGAHVELVSADFGAAAFGWGPDGTLYFPSVGCRSTTDACIRARRPDGLIYSALISGGTALVDGARACDGTDSSLADCTSLRADILGVAVDRDGSLCWSEGDDEAHRVRCRRGDRGNRVYTVAGLRSVSAARVDPEYDGMPATRTLIGQIGQIAFVGDGTLMVVDNTAGAGADARVRLVEPTLDGSLTADHLIASSDGAMLYRFNANGRHLQTLDALTRTVLAEFTYLDTATDPAYGRLLSIRDAEQRLTEINWASDGHIDIVAPGGITTRITRPDADGYVSQVQDPAGSHWDFTYDASFAGGLMHTFTDARAHMHSFGYEPHSGRLARDERPADVGSGAGPQLVLNPRALVGDGASEPWSQVTLAAPEDGAISEEGRNTRYRIRNLETGAFERQVIHGDPSGTHATTTSSLPADGADPTVTNWDGTTLVTSLSPDPRAEFGMDAPFVSAARITRPVSGIETTVAMRRGFAPGAVDPRLGTLTSEIDLPTTAADGSVSVHTASGTTTFVPSPTHVGGTFETVLTPGSGASDRMVHLTQDDRGRVTGLRLPGQSPICVLYANGTTRRPSRIHQGVSCTDAGAGTRDLGTFTYVDDASSSGARWLTDFTVGPALGEHLTTHIVPDMRGWVDSVTLPGRSSVLSVGFDAHGNLTRFTPPGRGAHLFSYTNRDGLATYTPPARTGAGGGAFSGAEISGTTYRPDGRFATRTLRDGRTITVGVESALGRVNSVVATGDAATSYGVDITPDVGGRPTLMIGTTGTLGLSWDGPVLADESSSLAMSTAGVSGRVTHVVDSSALLVREDLCLARTGHDCTAVTATSTGDAHLVYGYDEDRLLTSATLSGAASITLLRSFTPTASVIATTARTSTSVTATALGDVGQIAATDAPTGNTLYEVRVCARDNMGRVLVREERARTHSGGGGGGGGGHDDVLHYEYAYDARGFLRQYRQWHLNPPADWCAALRPSAHLDVSRSFTYDDAGNRADLAVNEDDQATVGARLYNGVGQLRQSGAADAFGGAQRSYSYDALGHLRRVVSHVADRRTPDVTTTYDYDPLGRLTAIRPSGGPVPAQRFLYHDGLNPIAWQRASTSCASGFDTAYFAYATRRDTPDLMALDVCTNGTIDANYQLLSDERGSVRVVVDLLDGTVVQAMEYDAWGVATQVVGAASLQPFGFIGGIRDGATGFWHLGARDYDPTIGRWTTEDPIGFMVSTTLYAYSGNDPVNFTDSSGLQFDPLTGAALGFGLAFFGNLASQYFLGDGEIDFSNALIAGVGGAAFGALGPIGIANGIIAGGAIGAAVNGVQQVANGTRPSCIDWNSVGAAAIWGGLGGGLANFGPPPTAPGMPFVTSSAIRGAVNPGLASSLNSAGLGPNLIYYLTTGLGDILAP